MSESYKKLVKTLQTIFEMDKADLDFGIYRIMNQKRDDINDFLENDLLSQVKKSFEDYNSEGRGELQQELEMAIEQAKKFGALDPETTDPVIEIRKRIDSSVDAVALENDVFSKLHTFFSRYYDKGDFISKRRYKADTYSIPYEGEEVKLYWANYDQYYIKSSEHLRDYAFMVEDDKKSVRIKLIKADTEKDNIKAKSGEERRFMLDKEYPLSEENGELLIHFNFLPIGKKKQEKLNEESIKTVFEQSGFDDWLTLLGQLAPTDKKPKRTLLERHLNEYTARNTFDYFIHKDLAGFLNRELDFFIKNEVLFLDDIDEASFSLTEQQLRKIKIIRSIAKKIIRMLAQLEDFQKKLWLKKKFVIETNYCITLDRIPFDEGLFKEIFSNDLQLTEWEDLFTIDRKQLDKDCDTLEWSELLGCTQYKSLVLDTKNFNSMFKERLVTNFECLDSSITGVVLNADNFQCLNFLANKYKDKIDGVYLDPPYNTDASEIIYKNGFKNSSWASLIRDRLTLVKSLQTNESALCVTIDDFEKSILKLNLNEIYGAENHLGTIAIRSNPQGRSTVRGFSINHEYGLFYAKTNQVESVGRLGHTEKQIERYKEKDENGDRFLWENFRKTGTDSAREDRKQQYFPLIVREESYRIPEMEWNSSEEVWVYSNDQLVENEEFIFPIDDNGNERVWKWGLSRVKEYPNHIKIYVDPRSGKKQLHRRNYLNLEGSLPNTWWDKSKYGAGSHGTNLLTAMLGKGHSFPFPKSLYAVEDCIKVITNNKSDAVVLDIFGGSGTTAHAVMNLNQFDNDKKSKRQFILAEMGEHFDTIVLPRIKKAAYSQSWSSGCPVSATEQIKIYKKQIKDLKNTKKIALHSSNGQEFLLEVASSEVEISKLEEKINRIKVVIGVDNSSELMSNSVLVKYMRLESYEDVLNNLNIASNKANQDLLNNNQNLKEDYMLGYWLDVETADSPSLLNIKQFEDPFNYKLNIGTGSVGVTKATTVDLVETFNYLIGLSVKTFDILQGFKVVIGTNPQDESVLIVWRNTKENNNDALEEFLDKQGYNPRDSEFDHIYVNGDHTLEDPRSIVKMTEIEFKRLMFDVEDV